MDQITYKMIVEDTQPLTDSDIIPNKISEEQLMRFIEIQNNNKVIDYIKLCLDLFNSEEGKYFKLENLSSRINGATNGQLLFMNFKSHNIFYKTNRTSLFDIINKTSPDFICLTEALVPISIATAANMSQQETDDKGVSNAVSQELKLVLEDKVKQPEGAYDKFTQFKKKKHEEEKEYDKEKKKEKEENVELIEGVKILTNVWIKAFKEMGYEYIIFCNPIDCPYGKNWGNCIISKEPITGKILHMNAKGTHKKFFAAEEGQLESRCMIHIEVEKDGKKHHILCTHLEDKDKDVRSAQTEQIIEYIDTNELKSSGQKITLVGDLNAIYKGSYNDVELQLLNKINFGGDVPIDAIEKLNRPDALGEELLINKNQQYESLYQKCVSHAYSNFYTKSLLIFTDATQFDHQPLLLIAEADAPTEARVSVSDRIKFFEGTK